MMGFANECFHIFTWRFLSFCAWVISDFVRPSWAKISWIFRSKLDCVSFRSFWIRSIEVSERFSETSMFSVFNAKSLNSSIALNFFHYFFCIVNYFTSRFFWPFGLVLPIRKAHSMRIHKGSYMIGKNKPTHFSRDKQIKKKDI